MMRVGLMNALAVVALCFLPAAAQEAQRARPRNIWNREGPLGETPTRVTDAYPLSDQSNRDGWVRFEPMSDEFSGDTLDTGKWNLGLPGWLGRQPGLFKGSNVAVRDGELGLTMRKEPLDPEFEARGYKDYSSAILHTQARTAYGYFETRAKPMNSAGSSSFWFKRDATPGYDTEIDVFELSGKAPGFENRVNMNLHVFRTPDENKHWSVGDHWVAPWRVADDYHVYGLEWTPEEIVNYVDGVRVRSVENTHWHQPLNLILDSETMPDWFGMPADEDLPSTFRVDYVRAWKRGDAAADSVEVAQSPHPEAWTPLFDGTSLDGWVFKSRPQDAGKRSYWKVIDGTITAQVPAGSDHHYLWLLTEREFGDFELRMKVRADGSKGGNSGVQVRSRYDDDEGWLDGPQVDINPPGPWRCGFIYDETRGAKVWLWPDVGAPANAKPEHAPANWTWRASDDPADPWNDVRITCLGPRITTWINGVQVADYDGTGRLDDAFHRERNVGLTGHIGLQIHPGQDLFVQFKEIAVRELQ